MLRTIGMTWGFSCCQRGQSWSCPTPRTVPMQESWPQAARISDYFQDKPEIRIFMWNIPLFKCRFNFKFMFSFKNENISACLTQSTGPLDSDLWDKQKKWWVLTSTQAMTTCLVFKWFVPMCFHLYMYKYIYTKHGQPMFLYTGRIFYSAVK